MSRIIVRKFKFADLALAFKVRQKMWNQLSKFDKNGNQRFEANEIRQALISILNQDQMEVQYVVNNVFRYDVDKDGAVTYAQFTNFSVQQHFGQMAIQRLHKKQYYVNGARRIMNLQQFQTTLNYCLNFIQSKGTHSQYEQLFRQVDLDRDGYISYQDYFIFLRQYFGSQSQAFEEEQKNPRLSPKKPQKKDQDNWTFSESPQNRFAKLIYSQFKIQVMMKDMNKNLILQRSEVQQILRSCFKLNSITQSDMLNNCMKGATSVNYQQFMINAIVTYMSTTSIKKYENSNKNLSQQQFIQLVNDSCHFVRIKPSQLVLRACFKSASKGNISLSLYDYSQMMKKIFRNFQFDSRGRLSSKGNNIY